MWGAPKTDPRQRRAAWVALAGLVVVALVLAACQERAPAVLGTLEYDRITLPAPAAERIVALAVREGERVEPGQPIVQLEATGPRGSTEAAVAEAERAREALAELEVGPRREEIARARAELAAARAEARDADSFYERQRILEERGAVAPVELDRARAAAHSADARVQAARARLLELERGSRAEDIAQAAAAASAARGRADTQEFLLHQLSVVAPRAGQVDSLPYHVGDRPPVGAPLAILLVGERPYARVYVPEPIRARVHVGAPALVHVDGVERPIEGRVRMVRSEPSFTPYYALIGEDAARLSYLAEIELDDPDAAGLPAGLPVRVELPREAERR